MSKYTTEVRWICESKSGFALDVLPTKSVDEIIDASWDLIFDFNFNFYNNTWNAAIAKFILKYYYTREIGFETVGLWKLKLNTRCAEISGKYNKMITAFETLEPEDYFYNYKFEGKNDRTDNLTNQRTDNLTNQRTDNLTNQRTDNLTRKRDGESKDKFSDTPQNGLTSVEDGTYLTNYRNIESDEEIKDTGTQTTTNTGTQTATNTGTQTTTNTGTQKTAYGETGYKGVSTLADYMANIDYEKFNIMEQIAKEFSDLFFLLW